MNATARLLKIIDGTRCEAECACGVRFVSDLDEDSQPGEVQCVTCRDSYLECA